MTQRLLSQLIPHHYDVLFDIADDLQSFRSETTLTATTTTETDRLTLHAKDLDVNSLEVTMNGRALAVTSHQMVPADDTLVIQLDTAIPADSELIILARASAHITPTMHGIYPATYTHGGQEHTIISTQLESHHAREAFVCIDEPAAKATFTVTLRGPADNTFLSNMPVASTTTNNGRSTVLFDPTPIMSTYLLAFVLGELDLVTASTKRGVTVNVYAAPQNAQYLDYALTVARDCLDFFESYFDIEYPLPKADFVAIPEFAAGAMENWGLITFRETALLHDPEQTSLTNKQRIAEVICHELAHQWFGNLVTMQWWDDLWLNEGFASWAATLASDALHPQWNLWANFIADDYAYGLSLDALASSRPIRMKVESPKDINEIFDAVSYSKSPSVIRMLHDYMGADNFKSGLRAYLRKYSYGNATTEDLWEQLSAHCDHDIAAFMDPWTTKLGYPVLSVNTKDDSLELGQKHFLLNPRATPDDTLWTVPLLPTTSEVTATELTAASMTIPAPSSPTKFNHDQSGFYRTAYAPALLDKLAEQLNSFSTQDRMGLLDDSFELAIAGHQDTVAALKLLAAYTDAPESYEWDIIGAAIGSVRSVLLTEEHEQLLAPLVAELIDKPYHRLGWTTLANEPDNDALIRPIVLGLAVRFRLFEADTTAKDLYQQATIHPDLRGIVYSAVARDGTAEDYQTIWQNYLQEPLQEQKNRWARALTQFKQPDLATETLHHITGPDVRLQDAISWLAGMFSNSHTRPIAWDWYQQHWDWITENFSDGHIYSYFATILSSFKQTSDIEAIRRFFKDKDLEGLERSLEQAIEKIEYQAAWHERDAASVKTYLTSLE